MSASSQYYSVTARVGVPHRHEVTVTVPLVGPAGATGPAGAAGASAWNDITGKPSTFAVATHASTHHTGGSDPLTAANIGAAKDFTEIEVGNSGTSTTTLTTAQLPARVILFLDASGEASATINLPTPDARQSGLTASIKVQRETGTTDSALITVVHSGTTLLDTELAEAEGSITFVWDGYEWSYSNKFFFANFAGRNLLLPATSGSLALTESADNVFRVVGSSDATKKVAFEVDGLTTGTTRTLTVPDASGTIARTEDFASPPAIGNTTPNSGAFTTLSASAASGAALTVTDTTTSSDLNYPLIVQRGTTRLFGVRDDAVAEASIFRIPNNPGSNVTAQIDSAGLKLRDTNSIQFSSTTNIFSPDTFLLRDAANALGQRNGVNSQEARLYATFTSSTNYQRMTVKSVRQTLSALSGASATTTGTFIPDGAVVVGVTTRVATLLTGAAGYEVGDGTDADRWGDITGTAVGTTSDNRDWTAGTIECFTAGGNITLTAKTSNFTAGAIEICVFYLAGEAD